MSKVAIITDSNSAITQKEAEELGVFVLPMPFFINEETHFEGIDLSQEQFYEALKDENADIKTSQPTPGSVIDLWESVLKDYDEIVHIPMSSGLSSACETAHMLSQDYEGKVFVVNNQRISVTQRQSVLDAIALTKKGYGAEKIKEILEREKFNSSIYIMLDTLHYLKKGGRITPAAAALGTILQLKPVLQIQGEKLDAFAKARTSQQGKSKMKAAIASDIENRFGGTKQQPNVHLCIAHTRNEEAALQLKEELEAEYPSTKVHIDPLSLSVSCHIGPGALAIAVSKYVPECLE